MAAYTKFLEHLGKFGEFFIITKFREPIKGTVSRKSWQDECMGH
jgi:hypothetical protein